jgi:hypothetical protein
VIGKTLDRMVAAAKKMPDAELSGDRMAVVQAVRGTSTKGPPPEKAPNYGSMDEAQFKRELSKFGL